MQLTITAANLKAALDVAAPATATSKRAQILPVLAHVLLDARDGMLTVSGTDLEQRAWQTVPAEVTEPGAVTLHGSAAQKDRYLAPDLAWAKAVVLDGAVADLPALGLF